MDNDQRHLNNRGNSLPSTPTTNEAQTKGASHSGSMFFNPFGYLNNFLTSWRWIPWSADTLDDAEDKLLRSVKASITLKVFWVWHKRYHLWSAVVESHKNKEKFVDKTPLVLIHGLGGGIGLWVKNYDALCQTRTVYAFDLLGFGKSGRPKFSNDPKTVTSEWVQSIEDFRREANLDRMILVGHSLGGYLASAYAAEYPNRVRHLVLADPWGFGVKGPGNERTVPVPGWVRTISSLTSILNPLFFLRALGPYGPSFLRRVRPDFGHKFAGSGHSDTIFDYIYHCNALPPSGESAFSVLALPYGWAKRPMIEQIASIKHDVPITFIYGSRSWIDCGPGYEIQQSIRQASYVRVEVISGAGHHVYADHCETFNTLINEVCDLVDSNGDRRRSQDHAKLEEDGYDADFKIDFTVPSSVLNSA